MRRIFYLIIICCLIVSTPDILNAQETNLTSGGDATSSNGSISYSVGQVFTETIFTLNLSIASGVQQPFELMQLNLKSLSVFSLLEGPYYGTDSMHTLLNTGNLVPLEQPYNTLPWNYNGAEEVVAIPPEVVDWVLVEIRVADAPQNATPETIEPGWPKALFILSSGQITDLDGISLPKINLPSVTGNLYVIVRHRNHIDVMSAYPLTLSGNQYVYDFTSALTQAYGGGAGFKEIAPGVFGMAGGDNDADGQVFTSDFNNWAVQFGNALLYTSADSDLDGSVFTSDFNKWAGNFGVTNPVEGGNAFCPAFVSQVPDNKANK